MLRAKHLIPEGGCHAEPPVGIFVVVLEVVLFEIYEERPGGFPPEMEEVVQRIISHHTESEGCGGEQCYFEVNEVPKEHKDDEDGRQYFLLLEDDTEGVCGEGVVDEVALGKFHELRLVGGLSQVELLMQVHPVEIILDRAPRKHRQGSAYKERHNIFNVLEMLDAEEEKNDPHNRHNRNIDPELCAINF